jgi:hypothetical protein
VRVPHYKGLSIGELGEAAAIEVEVATTWMQASLAVAAAARCSGAGSAFTGEASLDLAWLNSAGTLEGAATGFRRCGADTTAAGDEVWHVAVSAGSADVEVVGPHTPNQSAIVRLRLLASLCDKSIK